MKLALVIHGWPVPIHRTSGLYQLLEEKGYSVQAPYLLDGDEFNPGKAVSMLNGVLGGRSPDLIVGISMGGLILPLIAKNYPESKLIFVASGPMFKPISKKIDFITKLMASSVGEVGFSIMKIVPGGICDRLGFLGNADRSRDNFMAYSRIADRNRRYLKRMKSKVARDVARFLLKVDNTCVLRSLENLALVIFSENDQQMPETLALDLVNAIAKSDYVKTKGDHFKVLNDEVFYRMRDFI